MGRHAEAIVAYDLAINRSPQRAELWTNRGRSGERLGRLREAIADYEHALKLDATRYRLWQRHADLRYRQQRFGAALISYAQALAVQPLKEEEITSQCLFIASPGPYVQRYQAAFLSWIYAWKKR
ncbi:MAG: tetratricopeptide repeat protein [Synechococcales cyanobacterium RU_4_20]|nr:tetratricopeptide repeat protein [Synechococcales cyanobacterium RU_4_20]